MFGIKKKKTSESINEKKNSERRNHFRLSVSIPCSIKRYEKNEEDAKIMVNYEAKAVNISASGIQILVPVKLKKDEVVNCTIMLGDQGRMDFTLLVKWIEPAEVFGEGMFRIGLQYKYMIKADEDIIMKYIFSKQRKHKTIQ